MAALTPRGSLKEGGERYEKGTQGGDPRGGAGHRVLPATKVMPKEMLPIVDKPAIQYIVEEAAAAGIEDILIITNRGKGLLEDHLTAPPSWNGAWRGTPPKRPF